MDHNPIDMQANNNTPPSIRQKERAVFPVVHKEILREHSRAIGVLEDVEGGFQVGVAVGVVGAEFVAGEVVPGGFVEAGGQFVGELVGSAYAFLQGDVFFFGDQELGVVASELEVFHHGSGNFAVVLVLAEASVGRAFAGGRR